MDNYQFMSDKLRTQEAQGNLRRLPQVRFEGRYALSPERRRMLNLSSNDYLGLAADEELRSEFLATLGSATFRPTSSSSRLLTGNWPVYDELEAELARLYGREAALTFGSGYHANAGILPAVADARTLILADKLVHASLIDGIRLAAPARAIRYRHNDLGQLERLLDEYCATYERVIVVTESVFSMDGDRADLSALVDLKRRHAGVLLYVDEAHAFGVYGPTGLGCAEQAGCVGEIDFLVGTFGKAAASAGAFVVCDEVVRRYLVNRARTFIFTTALPPVCAAWTLFVVRRLAALGERRSRLQRISNEVCRAVADAGLACPSQSHIVPVITGDSPAAVRLADAMQEHGFYVLPVRPPTVPQGASRVRLSLTADLTPEEAGRLALALRQSCAAAASGVRQ